MKAQILLSFALSASALAEGAIPTAFQRARYEETYAASPFALATPEEPKVEKEPDTDFANLVLTGVGKLDDGRPWVVVRRTGDEASMRFEGNDPNREGLSVKEVKWADRWNQTSVILTKGGKVSEPVKFNENLAAAAPPPPNPGNRPPGTPPPPIVPGGGMSGARPPTAMSKPVPGAPNIPRPMPTSTGVPRPGGTTVAPGTASFRSGNISNPSAPGVQPANTGAPRQRVRTINNR